MSDKQTYSFESLSPVSFISLYLKLDGHEAGFSKVNGWSLPRTCDPILTDGGDPILLYETNQADPHAAPLFDDEFMHASRVSAGFLVDNVGK